MSSAELDFSELEKLLEEGLLDRYETRSTKHAFEVRLYAKRAGALFGQSLVLKTPDEGWCADLCGELAWLAEHWRGVMRAVLWGGNWE